MTDAVHREGSRFETEFAWPPGLARRAYVAYVWHRHAGWFVGSLLVGVLCLAMLGDRETRPLAAFGLGALLVWWRSWIFAYRRAGQAAATYGPIRVCMDEQGCETSSAQGTSRVPWKSIGGLFRLRQVWVLVRSEFTNPMAIPVASMSDEFRAFLESQVRAAGGRVR